jgi:hypothetical protein
MRWRVAALIAVAGIGAIPALSEAAQPGHAALLRVVVSPGTGSPRTHFAVSFRASQTTGRAVHNLYRVTAAVQGHGGCQSRTT